MMSHTKNTVIRRASNDTSNTKTFIMFVERLLLLSDCECEKGFMKLLKTMVCAFLCTTALSGCASKKNRELNIWVITDLHYLAENLFRKEASSFQKILESSGGKMIEYMPEIMREFKEKAIAEHPDAILVPGDITFNGEYESMEELKPYFHSIQSEGIPVLMIPGNHDINYPYAGSFTGDGMFGVRNITQAEFTDQMGSFGYEQALSHAPDSFSYTYALADDLWIMTIDANTEAAPGTVTAETLVWMEEQLQKAAQEKIHVITMSHQNVLRQSDYMYKGFIINNADVIEKMLKKYHVSLNLSGHAHLQHTAYDGTLTDICTESAAIYPMGYGVLQIGEDHKRVEYTKAVFQNNQDQAEERLVHTIHDMVASSLRETTTPQEYQADMIRYAEEVNEAYFTGELQDSSELLNRKEFQLWRQYGETTFIYQYINAILTEFKPSSKES